MPQNIESYLRNLQTTDAVRADAWDAIYTSDDPTGVEQRLRGVRGLTDTTKARLWDLRFPAAPTGADSTTAPENPYSANILARAVGIGRGVIGGIGQGVMSTGLHIDDLVRTASERAGSDSQPRPLQNPDVQTLIEPYSTAAKVGKAAEQIAEIAVPGGAVAKATKGAGLLTRMGAQAATAGVVATAQTGDPEQAPVPAVVSGGMPVVGAGVQAVGRRIMGRALEPGVNAAAAERARLGPGERLSVDEIQSTRQQLTDTALRFRLGGNRDPEPTKFARPASRLHEIFIERVTKPNPSVNDRLDALKMLDDFPVAERDDWLRRLSNLPQWRPVIDRFLNATPAHRAPEDIASTILASRAPTPINWQSTEGGGFRVSGAGGARRRCAERRSAHGQISLVFDTPGQTSLLHASEVKPWQRMLFFLVCPS